MSEEPVIQGERNKPSASALAARGGPSATAPSHHRYPCTLRSEVPLHTPLATLRSGRRDRASLWFRDHCLQGYLTHKTQPPHTTLQQD